MNIVKNIFKFGLPIVAILMIAVGQWDTALMNVGVASMFWLD